MRSLFFKIFLWFWATIIVTAIALILTFIFRSHGVPAGWQEALIASARYYWGATTVQEMESGGTSAASARLERVERERHLRACLFDSSKEPIAGNDCGTFKDVVSRVTSSTSGFSMRYGVARAAFTMRGNSKRDYIFATELPFGPRAAFRANRGVILMEWSIALLVSGFICYLLTRHLTKPILELRQAAQQLASGDLDTRAASGIDRRRDELGDLVRDFNAMAEHIEQLISQQRQLIYDVSHELRSPLARLNVALDLARERKGTDSAFDHMEQDLGRLNEMIERMLTIARIETSPSSIQHETINLVDLVSQISRNAEFESQERGVHVKIAAASECSVRGDTRLLESAIENVVRNAIHYTASGSTVQIALKSPDGGTRPLVQVLVRDHGPGIPESELTNIFRPFYRVTEARDRQSGGTGLGLTIAERIVRIHGGTIQVRNISPNGLEVEILLPNRQLA